MKLRDRFARSRCAGDPSAAIASPPAPEPTPGEQGPPGLASAAAAPPGEPGELPGRPVASPEPAGRRPSRAPGVATPIGSPSSAVGGRGSTASAGAIGWTPPEALADGEASQTYRLYRRRPAWQSAPPRSAASSPAGSPALPPGPATAAVSGPTLPPASGRSMASASRPAQPSTPTRAQPEMAAVLPRLAAATPDPPEPAAGERVEHEGYRITRLRVPCGGDPSARPRVLGGALERLTWPTLARWREIAAILGGGPAGQEVGGEDDGGVPMIALDTETTGVSRSAGTLAFLIGLCWLEPATIVVEQWTLTALAGEPALLRALGERLDGLGGPATALVTFNGKSFDLPLLRARFRRLRREPARLGGPHLDLLLPARRLWREPAGDCRLKTLERTRLGVVRHDDVAGHEIPGAFWTWIERPGDRAAASRIDQVHAHNQVDLLTLPALADALAQAVVAPGSLREALAVARWQGSRGLPHAALGALERWLPAAPAIDPVATPGGPRDDPRAASGPSGGDAAPPGPEAPGATAADPPPQAAGGPSGAPGSDALPHAGPRSPGIDPPRAAVGPGSPAADARGREARRPRGHALGGLGERMVRLGLVGHPGARAPREGERFPIVRGASPTARRPELRAFDRADDGVVDPPPAAAGRDGTSHRGDRLPDPAAPAPGFTGPLSVLEREALALAARLWRRVGEPARAAACWARICRDRPGDPEAHEALAGLLEHRLGDLQAALRVAERSSDPCPRRLRRLGRKLSRRSPPGPHSVYG